MTLRTNRRRAIALLGASACAACTGSPTASRRFSLTAEIDTALERMLALDLAPGFGVAVYSREGGHVRGVGLADILTRERVSGDTAFYVASSTKSMTALALACLAARGEIDLDANLAQLCPDGTFPSATQPAKVRLRDLITHAGGIANEPIEYRFTYSGQHDADTLWRLLAASELNQAAPLGRFQYANVGYNIGTILTDRSLGVRWQDLLRNEIFAPAGLMRTSAFMSQAVAGGWSIAKPHRLDRSGKRERNYLEKTDQTMHSAGGVIMSPRDALRWLQLVVEDGRIGRRQCVPAEVVQATRTPSVVVGAELDGYVREHYGLGWYIGPYRGQRMLHHFGGFSGFRAHVSYLPEQAIGVAAFTNDSTVGLRLINAIVNYVYDRAGGHADAEQQFRDALHAASDSYTATARRVADAARGRAALPLTLVRDIPAYVGRYENSLWGRIEITAESGGLRATDGVLRARAEPADERDAIWLELSPGEGTMLQFEGTADRPDSLRYAGRTYRRI